MARGATGFRVDMPAMLGAAGDGVLPGGVVLEAADIPDDLLKIVGGEFEGRHGGAGDAEADHALDGVIAFAVTQRRGDQIWTAAAGSGHAMAEGAITAEQGAALFQAGLGTQGRGNQEDEEPF